MQESFLREARHKRNKLIIAIGLSVRRKGYLYYSWSYLIFNKQTCTAFVNWSHKLGDLTFLNAINSIMFNNP